MPLLTLQNFWGNVIWSAANCSFAFAVKLEFGSKTEISNLNFHFVIDEQISKF